MIGNILKSVYKYTGMCIIGALVCTAYAPSARADICFLPGGDCIHDLGEINTFERSEVLTPTNDRGEICTIAREPVNEICVHCADGNFKDCQCASGFERTGSGNCIAKCKGGSTRQVDGTCRCPSGTTMCNDTCMADTKQGNFVLNPSLCRYDCATGTELVPGLNGCFEKCNTTLGESHNTSTGKCECPEGQEHVAQLGNVCKPVCPANQSRDEQGICQSGPRCDSPKILINGSCYDCSDYVLRDYLETSYSDSISLDQYSGAYYAALESCSARGSVRKFPHYVRESGGSCTRCHESVNLWKCNVNGQDVRNFAELCYAMGYTYKLSPNVCSSPFVNVSREDVTNYNYAMNYAYKQLRAWGLNKEGILTGSTCTECPFSSDYVKCDGRCNQFDTTHGDASYMESTGKYTCLECPQHILYEGAGSTMNTYFCHRNDCPDGTVYDAAEDECITQSCGDRGFKVLDPIDICMLGTCGVPSVESIIGSVSDGYSGGGKKCQYSEQHKYTAAQAAKLTNAGYVCTTGYLCPGMYACDPAVPLAKAVRDNGGSCEECGSNPTKHKCMIGGQRIDEPIDLCNYLGYTLTLADYTNYFAPDPHTTGCGFMACGVGPSQYGAPNAIERYKCSCASGYKFTNTGCVKEHSCNPYCGYSDSCSAGDGYSSCIAPAPLPIDDNPELRCLSEGYVYMEGDTVFQCGYYRQNACALCPYTNNPKMYKCSSGEKNEACDVGSECWCCMYPDTSDCNKQPSYSDGMSGGNSGPDPKEVCTTAGYYKASTTEMEQILDGTLQCSICDADSNYIKSCTNLADLCRNEGYTIVDVRGSLGIIIAQGATCERCPYNSKYNKCEMPNPTPPDPCDGYSVVACDITTHQCSDMVSGCGCINCAEPAGTICTRDKQCSQALNQWGRCEGTCICTGVTCGTGETCKQTNACGNCVAGQCECPGTKCSEDQICNGSANACGNCTGTCVDKGCPEGYSPTNPGGCPNTATSGDGTTICYGNYKKCTCPEGKVESCGSDKKSTGSEVIGDTTCYTCVNKTCADYGYQSSSYCSTGYTAQSVSVGNGLSCYDCIQDVYSDSDSDAIHDGISNGGGSSGGGSCSTCANYPCNNISCYTTTQGYYGGAVTTHGCEFNGSYGAGSCAMKCCVCGQINGDKYGACASLKAQCTSEAKAQGCVDQ